MLDAAWLNFALAVSIWFLVATAGFTVIRTGTMPTPMVVLWLSYLSLATVQVISSAVVPLDLREDIDAIRWLTSFFRAVTLCLLAGYVWHRVADRA